MIDTRPALAPALFLSALISGLLVVPGPGGLSFAAAAVSEGAGETTVSGVGAQDPLVLGYEVYVGGMNVFAFEMTLALEEGRYALTGHGATKGMARWLFRWDVDASATGRLESDLAAVAQALPLKAVVADAYSLQTERRRAAERKRLDLRFEAGNDFEIRRDPPDTAHRAEKRDLPDALPPGTLDPLSAGLAAAFSGLQDRPCSTTVPVFDGDRRYDLRLSPLGLETIATRGYMAYRGEALRCRIDVDRISGFRERQIGLSSWDDHDPVPTSLWLARISPSFPPVPVRIHADFTFGFMIVYLTRAESGGRPVLGADGRPVASPGAEEARMLAPVVHP